MTKNAIKQWAQLLLDPIFLYLAIAATKLLLIATIWVYLVEVGKNPKINSYFDSLWWGIATITTIGYGDILPLDEEIRKERIDTMRVEKLLKKLQNHLEHLENKK